MADQKERRAAVMETLRGLCGSEDFPEVEKIEAAEDMARYTVTLTSETVTPAAFTLAAMLEMYTRSWYMVQGTESPSCSVRFVSAATGETIEET